MPRDKRLYMTFPIDFHRHPKIMRLPVEVRWTFVEMNGEARLADNDGVFAAEDAEFMWPVEHLTTLTRSHPTRPLLRRDGDRYVLREYGEHQETKASREARRARNAENGAKGGRPPKNPDKTDSVSGGFEGKPGRKPTKAESESESELEGTYVSQSSYVPEREQPVDKSARAAMTGMELDPDRLMRLIHAHTQRTLAPSGALRVAVEWLDKGVNVRNPMAYLTKCLKDTPIEIQKYIDTNGLTP